MTAISHIEHRGSPEPLLSGNFRNDTAGIPRASRGRDLTDPCIEVAELALPLGGEGGPAGVGLAHVPTKDLRSAGHLPHEFASLLKEWA